MPAGKHTQYFHSPSVTAAATSLFKWLTPQRQLINAVRVWARSLTAVTVGTVDVKAAGVTILTAPLDLLSAQALPAAVVTALVATSSGNVDAGAHLYKVTNVTAIGETAASLASVSITNDGTHKQNTVTLVAGPAGTIARNIYRTQQGGSTYTLVATVADNTTLSFTDNVADATIVSNAAAPTVSTVAQAALSAVLTNVLAGVDVPASTEISVDVAITGTSIDRLSVQIDSTPLD